MLKKKKEKRTHDFIGGQCEEPCSWRGPSRAEAASEQSGPAPHGGGCGLASCRSCGGFVDTAAGTCQGDVSCVLDRPGLRPAMSRRCCPHHSSLLRRQSPWRAICSSHWTCRTVARCTVLRATGTLRALTTDPADAVSLGRQPLPAHG